jgi:hypothetical protein
MIDRYDLCNSGSMYNDDHGEWVMYEDAAARIAELEAALNLITNRAEFSIGFNNDFFNFKWMVKSARAALKANPMTNANEKGE